MPDDPGAAFGPHPFWDFSLSTYAADGVAPACLALQDRLGLDVNVLLFCLWTGCRGIQLPAADLARAAGAASEWSRSVVEPIRAARRRMKAGSPHLDPVATETVRRDVQAAEIACERAEQMILARLSEALAPNAPAEDAVAANLAGYLALLDIVADEDDRAALHVLIAAVLPAEGADRALARLAPARPPIDGNGPRG